MKMFANADRTPIGCVGLVGYIKFDFKAHECAVGCCLLWWRISFFLRGDK